MSNHKVVQTLKKLRQLTPPDLFHVVQLIKQEHPAENTAINYYQILDEPNTPGYLIIYYDPITWNISSAEMNVNFNSLIGFNRSPIELRLLSQHILLHLPGNL